MYIIAKPLSYRVVPHVVIIILVEQGGRTFKSVDEIVARDHSYESSRAERSRGFVQHYIWDSVCPFLTVALLEIKRKAPNGSIFQTLNPSVRPFK